MEKKNSHPEILVILSFDLFQLLHGVSFQLWTIGIFYLVCSSLENYLETLPFKSMPWLSILLSLLLLLRSIPILQLYAHTWQIIDMSIQQYWGGVGRGSPTELAQLAVPKKVPPLAVGLVSTVMKFLASILNGFKKFCIWRMEMLIYLF